MEEIFDVYTRDGKYIGTKEKSLCHSSDPGCYHKPVWIWIINNKQEILIQKRASCKKNYPNKWDMPSAGHILAGESIIDGAIRETKEELGIDTIGTDYQFLFEYIYDKSFEIAEVFLLRINIDVANMQLQKEEVSEVKWLSYRDFEKIFYSEEFVPFPKDYKEKVLQVLKENI